MIKNRNYQQHKKINNYGVSLVEFIIVIAIMAVLGGLITISLSTLLGREAQKASEKIASELSRVRFQTMGKNNTTAEIYKGTDGNYYLKTTQTVSGVTSSSEEVIGTKSVEIYFSEDNLEKENYSSATKLTESNEILIAFDRASGAFADISGVPKYQTIYAVQGSKVFKLRFYRETGKIVQE